jgi:hypothetical protein
MIKYIKIILIISVIQSLATFAVSTTQCPICQGSGYTKNLIFFGSINDPQYGLRHDDRPDYGYRFPVCPKCKSTGEIEEARMSITSCDNSYSQFHEPLMTSYNYWEDLFSNNQSEFKFVLDISSKDELKDNEGCCNSLKNCFVPLFRFFNNKSHKD